MQLKNWSMSSWVCPTGRKDIITFLKMRLLTSKASHANKKRPLHDLVVLSNCRLKIGGNFPLFALMSTKVSHIACESNHSVMIETLHINCVIHTYIRYLDSDVVTLGEVCRAGIGISAYSVHDDSHDVELQTIGCVSSVALERLVW